MRYAIIRVRWLKLMLVWLSVPLLVLWTSEKSARNDTMQGNLAVGPGPFAIAVNPVTNKIYVGNDGGSTVTVIDGTNNSTATVTTGTSPAAIGVNTATNKIYVANTRSSNVTVIDG